MIGTLVHTDDLARRQASAVDVVVIAKQAICSRNAKWLIESS